MKNYLLLICLFFCFQLLSATEPDSSRWRPSFSLDYTAELQTNWRSVRAASLLHFAGSLPVGSRFAVDFGMLSTISTPADEPLIPDCQGFSNIDAEALPLALTVAGLSWQINDRHQLFAGIRRMDEDYFTSPSLSLFTNSSAGCLPTISFNGPVPIFPYSGPGVHYKWNDGPWSVQGSVYYHYNLFGMAQADYSHKGGHYYLGAIYGTGFGSAADWGSLWFQAEQQVLPSLELFGLYSCGIGSEAGCRHFAALGARYEVGCCTLGVMSDYANLNLLDAPIEEFATELTCEFSLESLLKLRRGHIGLQPTLHMITTDGAFNLVGSLRLNVEF